MIQVLTGLGKGLTGGFPKASGGLFSGGPKDDLGGIRKSLKMAVSRALSDTKSRVPPKIKKAVREKYRGTKASDPGLKPTAKIVGGDDGVLMAHVGMPEVILTYRGKRKALTLSGVPAPFTAKGPYGKKKSQRVSAKAPSKPYARGWLRPSVPWKVDSPIGKVDFGENKDRLFALPSKDRKVPILFRRGDGLTSTGKKRIQSIATLSIPHEVLATERVWRTKVNEVLRERLRHHFSRLKISFDIEE